MGPHFRFSISFLLFHQTDIYRFKLNLTVHSLKSKKRKNPQARCASSLPSLACSSSESPALRPNPNARPPLAPATTPSSNSPGTFRSSSSASTRLSRSTRASSPASPAAPPPATTTSRACSSRTAWAFLLSSRSALRSPALRPPAVNSLSPASPVASHTSRTPPSSKPMSRVPSSV